MRILLYLFFFLFCLAVAEIWALRFVIGRIGLWPALALVLGTGALGAYVAKENAKLALSDLAKSNWSSGPPAKRVIDAIIFFMAALLLIIPGLITDVAGLVLMLPFTRNALFNSIKRQYQSAVDKNNPNVGNSLPDNKTERDGEIIEVEAEDDS
jgi:UPF0716 protein FxsA